MVDTAYKITYLILIPARPNFYRPFLEKGGWESSKLFYMALAIFSVIVTMVIKVYLLFHVDVKVH